MSDREWRDVLRRNPDVLRALRRLIADHPRRLEPVADLLTPEAVSGDRSSWRPFTDDERDSARSGGWD